MEPTNDELYLNGQMALDALSIVFGGADFETLLHKDDGDNKFPIGFQLQRDRASPHLSKIEYRERNIHTMELAEKWEVALLQWTTARGRSQCSFESITKEPVPCKKRNADSDVNSTRQTKKNSHKICCVDGCDGDESELKRVPEYPTELPTDASDRLRIKYAKKFFIRKECTKRLGFTRTCCFKNLRACQKHWVLVTGKSTMCQLVQANGESKDESITIPPFWAPQRIGDKSFHSPPETESKGNSTDRATFRHVMEISNNEQALANQQILEMHDVDRGEQDFGNINPRILSAAGLDVHLNAHDGCATRDTITDTTDDLNDSWRMPAITLAKLVPNEVKRRTGFHDLKLMLSFAALICGGDLAVMTRTSSQLTWLEEWLFYFEFGWGRGTIQLCDYITTYRCREKSLRFILRDKVSLVQAMRARWPMYASYAEDAKFRDPAWSGHFDPINGHRVIMHDSTNIPLATPSSAALQRALYNSYYGMCCAKAGVAVQLCGYIYGLPLCTGHSDDTRFIKDTCILEKQQQFSDNDKTSTKPFLNVFDKGYQCLLDANAHGGQFCLQPAFAESEKQFKTNAVLHSGAVAVVRSGNERAVNRCKMSWFLKRGAKDQMWDIDFLCDMWEAWTFQINFMYEKFL